MSTMILCEKPSVAATVAAALGADKKRNGYIEGNGYTVSWCFGHLLELAAPDAYGEQYAKWRYEDLPIVPQVWKHTPSKDKAAQLKILKELMNSDGVECVVNAADAGREGELIFRHVYEYAKCRKPIKRLWISSMEDAAIRDGFANLKVGADYDALCAAAKCREQADWLVGLNATRLFTVLYGGATLNVGRVQSPTLAMLVKRETEIANFVKTPFYTVELALGGVTATGDRLDDRANAESVRDNCDGRTAVVTDVTREQKSVSAPKLYDLTSLQRDANRLLGFTAQQTLDYAQSLYEQKLLTYPRTDSRHITADMRGTVAALLTGMGFEPIIDALVGAVSDHHALLPTAQSLTADLSALPSGERDILNLVSARLKCAVAPAHRYEAVTAVFDCSGLAFTAKGKTVIENGWKAVERAFKASLKNKTDEDAEDAPALPQLSKGQTFESVAASVKEGATAPPKHFTEDTILSAMERAGADETDDSVERKGLGTSATRASILERLVKSGLAERSKKNLLPTDKGKNLIAVLPDALVSAKLTAEWENKLLEVQRGELAADEFMSGIAAFIKAIVAENNAPKPEFANLFPNDKRNAASNAPSLGLCPRCGGDVTEWDKGFSCVNSKTCGFKLWKESKFFTAKKKPLTAAIVTRLLKDGKVALKDLWSEKTGKTYSATVMLDDDGGKFVNFKMVFEKGKVVK